MDMEFVTLKDIVIVTLVMLHHIVLYKGREEVKTVDRQVSQTQALHGSHGLYFALPLFHFHSYASLWHTIGEQSYKCLKKERQKIGGCGLKIPILSTNSRDIQIR